MFSVTSFLLRASYLAFFGTLSWTSNLDRLQRTVVMLSRFYTSALAVVLIIELFSAAALDLTIAFTRRS